MVPIPHGMSWVTEQQPSTGNTDAKTASSFQKLDWFLNIMKRVFTKQTNLHFMAATTRQQKVAKLIQKEMSDIFLRDRRGVLDNAFVSIIDVRVSPDLSVAKIYLSMMLAKDKNALLEKINSHKKELRKLLGDKVGKQLRIVPEIVFYMDEVEEKANRLDEIIKNLNIPPASDTQ
jgi:ribosome-binding factor A